MISRKGVLTPGAGKKPRGRPKSIADVVRVEQPLAKRFDTTEDRQRYFLKAMAGKVTIVAACRSALISRQTYYEWMKDPEFARKVDAVVQNTVDDMIEELRGSAAADHDHRTMLKMIAAHRPEYRDQRGDGDGRGDTQVVVVYDKPPQLLVPAPEPAPLLGTFSIVEEPPQTDAEGSV